MDEPVGGEGGGGAEEEDGKEESGSHERERVLRVVEYTTCGVAAVRKWVWRRFGL